VVTSNVLPLADDTRGTQREQSLGVASRERAVQPLFIFSISRSGSTLLQRIVGAHEAVATSSEPWILLPLLGPLKKDIRPFGRWHSLTATGVENFSGTLDGGPAAFRREMLDTALRLYRGAAHRGERYFLDKTPPYLYLVEEIIELFDSARFVFLWRNPLSVIASCVDTWEGGDWRMRNYRGDLFDGLPILTRAYERYKDQVFSIRYEDFVAGEDSEALPRLFQYLGLEWDPTVLSSFHDVQLSGPLGDQTGTARYSELSDKPLYKWRETICNPLRKAWCARYLRWLGRERLAIMGYDQDTLLNDLESVSMGGRNLVRDTELLGGLALLEMLKARGGEQMAPSSWRRLLSVDQSTR
jgi:Sulfotransferase family